MAEMKLTPPRRTWLNGVLFALTFLSVWYVGLGLGASYVHPEIMGGPSADLPDPSVLGEPRVLPVELDYVLAARPQVARGHADEKDVVADGGSSPLDLEELIAGCFQHTLLVELPVVKRLDVVLR